MKNVRALHGTNKLVILIIFTCCIEFSYRERLDCFSLPRPESNFDLFFQVLSSQARKQCRKSCRLRWLNYLKPNIKRGEFAMEELDLLSRMHKLIGNRWSIIAGRLPGRTANDIKNYWNTHLKKKQPEISNIGMMMNINNVEDDDYKQINSSTIASTRNDKGKVHVIRPKAQRFSEKSKWVMHRSSDHDQQPSSSSSTKMVVNSTESTDDHEPLPEFLIDEALTSWWQENIDLVLTSHDDDHERMINKKEVVLQTESGAAADQVVINSGSSCCFCYKTTTDPSSTMISKGKEQDLSVDDYLLEKRKFHDEKRNTNNVVGDEGL